MRLSFARMRSAGTTLRYMVIPLELKVAAVAVFVWAFLGSAGSTIQP